MPSVAPSPVIFQTFSSHGTHKLGIKILQHTKKDITFLLIWQKNTYNFDSFTLDGYFCVGCCHFFFNLTNPREKRSVPLTQVLNILKTPVAHQLQTADLVVSSIWQMRSNDLPEAEWPSPARTELGASLPGPFSVTCHHSRRAWLLTFFKKLTWVHKIR